MYHGVYSVHPDRSVTSWGRRVARISPKRALMSSLAAVLLAAADHSRCPAFDMRLHRPARATGAITSVGAEVAGVSLALCDSILAEFVLLSLRLLLPLVLPSAARRGGAAWRRPRQLWRRGAAAAIIRRLGRAASASPAAFSGPRGSPVRLAAVCYVCKKVPGVAAYFLALCVCLRMCHVCS